MMKKPTLTCLTLLLSVFTFAQNNQVIHKDFEKKVHLVVNSFQLNDHVNITQLMLDEDHFVLMAIDDKMNIVWRPPWMVLH